MSKSLRAALLLGALQVTSPALAEDNRLAPRAGSWFTQNGPITIHFRKKSEVSVNGAPAAGVEANPKNDYTISNSIGYHFTSNISAQLVLGLPPETSVTNQAGTVLGKMTYGAPSVVLDYRFTNFGAFQPFIGVGAMYIFVKDETDGALTNLRVDNTFGLILRAGAEIMIDNRWGLYFAANKIFADTEASGFLGADRVDAKLDLDPWIVQGGITYRF